VPGAQHVYFAPIDPGFLAKQFRIRVVPHLPEYFFVQLCFLVRWNVHRRDAVLCAAIHGQQAIRPGHKRLLADEALWSWFEPC
jgi:hypothetical protein